MTKKGAANYCLLHPHKVYGYGNWFRIQHSSEYAGTG